MEKHTSVTCFINLGQVFLNIAINENHTCPWHVRARRPRMAKNFAGYIVAPTFTVDLKTWTQ